MSDRIKRGDMLTLTIEHDTDRRYPEWYCVLDGPDGLTLGSYAGARLATVLRVIAKEIEAAL